MYKVISTKKSDETILASFDNLEEAKEYAKKCEKLPQYCDCVITVQANGRLYY